MVSIANVIIWDVQVGVIRWDESNQLGHFQYNTNFIKKGWELSPIKMPISESTRVFSFNDLRKGRNDIENAFNGLPGMLSDSLPDKYGNKLINTWLAQHGRPAFSMDSVEKLCFLGTRGMGALEFEPSRTATDSEGFLIELNSLVEMSRKMLHKRKEFTAKLNSDEKQRMIEILKIGTSAGGARPKAVIAYNPETKKIRSGQCNSNQGYEHWLPKLDGVSGKQFGENSGWGRVEYAYYLMAKDCKIEMTESQLLEENGRTHFMTKRFDRENNVKHHIQSLCGLQHYDFNDMFGYSYEQVFQTMRLLRLSYPEAEQMFRRMVFNVLATNYDDHTKNFSFILKKGDQWKLAPAYDLCFSFNPYNHWVSQQTLSVNGKRLDIMKEDFFVLAKRNNIKKADKIIDQINATVKSWYQYADKALIKTELKDYIFNNLNTF